MFPQVSRLKTTTVIIIIIIIIIIIVTTTTITTITTTTIIILLLSYLPEYKTWYFYALAAEKINLLTYMNKVNYFTMICLVTGRTKY
jgi:hypothetical protein